MATPPMRRALPLDDETCACLNVRPTRRESIASRAGIMIAFAEQPARRLAHDDDGAAGEAPSTQTPHVARADHHLSRRVRTSFESRSAIGLRWLARPISPASVAIKIVPGQCRRALNTFLDIARPTLSSLCASIRHYGRNVIDETSHRTIIFLVTRASSLRMSANIVRLFMMLCASNSASGFAYVYKRLTMK